MLLACLALLCVTAGAVRYNCSADVHDFQTVIADATDTCCGSITYICRLCGYSYTEVIPAYGHLWSAWITDQQPTCVKAGHAYRLCRRGDAREDKEIPETGVHNDRVQTIQPSCTTPGEKKYTCKNCGRSFEGPFGAPLGHSYLRTVAKAASCDQAGTAVYTCTRCGASYTKPIPALGHKYGGWIVDAQPAPGREGHEYRICRNNPAEIQGKTLPALPAESEGKETGPNALDYTLCAAEAALLSFSSCALVSQRRILRWDKAQEQKYRNRGRENDAKQLG